VRAAVFTLMRWWLDRGVDGFRMDVVNVLSKPAELADAPVRPAGFGDGLMQCTYGPHIHDYLAQMKREVFDSRPGRFLSVGEMPGSTPEQALRFTDRESGQLDMVFQFEHVDLDHAGSKWEHRPMTWLDMKRSLGRWQQAMGDRGWNSLYFSNHDQPRSVSRFGNDRVEGDSAYWRESATALATLLHLHRGTPYVYQGEELGMTNVPFDSIDDFCDVESLNHYRTAVELGHDPEAVLVDLRRTSRDNARTPMQWSAAPHAGFTTGMPWLPANPNHRWLNVEAQREDPRSVLTYYKALVTLRHTEPVLVEGDFTMVAPDHPRLYAFDRRLGEEWLAVRVNVSDEPLPGELPEGELLLGNYDDPGVGLAPWEARVIRVR
jgi:oligo-1,6-glucosidase